MLRAKWLRTAAASGVTAMVAVAAITSCSSSHPRVVYDAVIPPTAESAAPVAARERASPDEFLVALTDRAALSSLEEMGFGLGTMGFGAGAKTTAELSALPGAESLLTVLRDDVRAAKRTYPLAKVTSMDGFRLFDERWLASEETRFELVGVFNRLDRRVFYPGTCGEVRFVYRLAYRTTHAGAAMAGRLPLTVNVVFFVSDAGGCAEVARAWRAPRGLAGADGAVWLASQGALSSPAQSSWSLKSIETNLQSFRLQSFVHPTLAGHIDYVLRVFHRRGEGFVAAPMENMPDVSSISKNPALRAELLAMLRDPAALAAIDQGTFNLPERFLATRAVSVSPRGLERPGNRPFRTLFQDSDFAGAPLAGTKTIGSPKALLRRLDEATCTGCHQSRSIAGFHHVGEDAPEHPAFDALFSGSSMHLTRDLVRRREYVQKVALGETPDEFRPFPEREGVGDGFGAPCGLGDPGFAQWKCAEGFHCESLEDSEVGTCLGDSGVGSPCQYGTLVSKSAPHRDLIANMKNVSCSETQRCDNNRSGFPLGACAASCSPAAKGSTCADFLDADAFQNCLRAKRTFEQCEKEHVFGAGLRACNAENPCRQDYVCVRTRTAGVGACVPPYFVYQLRLDGYPLPR
jgi:hypothetical protein